MSANTITGNNTFPALVNKIEDGDPVTGAVVQLAVGQLCDRTQALMAGYYQTAVYDTPGVYALNYSSILSRLVSVEFWVVGGGESGGMAYSPFYEGNIGGAAGAINYCLIPGPGSVNSGQTYTTGEFQLEVGQGGTGLNFLPSFNTVAGKGKPSLVRLGSASDSPVICYAAGGGDMDRFTTEAGGTAYFTPSPSGALWSATTATQQSYSGGSARGPGLSAGGTYKPLDPTAAIPTSGVTDTGYRNGGRHGWWRPTTNGSDMRPGKAGTGAGAGGGASCWINGSALGAYYNFYGGRGGFYLPSPALHQATDGVIIPNATYYGDGTHGKGAAGLIMVRFCFRAVPV